MFDYKVDIHVISHEMDSIFQLYMIAENENFVN